VPFKGLPEFTAALERLKVGADVAGFEATKEGAALIEDRTKKAVLAQSHGKGTPTPSAPGQPPATITGNLARSVTTQGPVRVGFGAYEARVGPTTVYGRVQELGGGRSNLPPRPYLGPTVIALRGELFATYERAWAGALSL